MEDLITEYWSYGSKKRVKFIGYHYLVRYKFSIVNDIDG